MMPSRAEAHLRHIRHYAHTVAYVDVLYQQAGANTQAGLRLFDQERLQISAGWAWAEAHLKEYASEIPALICTFADATLYIGLLRYDIHRERIPQLKLARLAAQHLGQKKTEAVFLDALGQAYADLDQFSRAIDYHTVCLELAHTLEDHQVEGAALGH
jgi:hypothetical protein